LTDRLGPVVEQQIRSIFEQFKVHINLELQRRACEYSEFWAADARKRKIILEQIPPLQTLAASQNIDTGVKVVEPAEPTERRQPANGGFNPLDVVFSPSTPDPLAPSETTSAILKLFDTGPVNPNPTQPPFGIPGMAPFTFGNSDPNALANLAFLGPSMTGPPTQQTGTNNLPLGSLF